MHRHVALIVFYAGKWTEPLPSDIDDIVPVEIAHLTNFVQPLAHCWDRIGHRLRVKKVKELVSTSASGIQKMTRIFESWEECNPSWNDLLSVLEEEQQTATASSIRAFLHEGQ